jgi:hypothetical protein
MKEYILLCSLTNVAKYLGTAVFKFCVVRVFRGYFYDTVSKYTLQNRMTER